MVVNISFQKQENSSVSSILSITRYCYLYGKQLTYHDPICCVRVVYHDVNIKKHQEVIEFAEHQPYFPTNKLAYLKSESWMSHFPNLFEAEEFELEELPNYYCYMCVVGYKNHQPEYIQVIAKEPISVKLQKQLETSAKALKQYIEIYSENFHQKSRIQLLEHVLHKASHQLRNSLSSIALYVHNLCLQLSNRHYQRQAKIIIDNVNKLDLNLTEILSCGQGVKLNIASQDLKEIVAESINNFQPIISQKHLKINIPNTPGILRLDKFQIQQVFDNLIGNAVYFSPDFGNIFISWQVFQEEILIKICDEGPGISPQDIQKIFNPFYSRRDGGTGLGLTIAKKIILDHNGHLWADNTPQGGAAFSVILPIK